MARAARQLKILDIIAKYDVDTQEELVEKLKTEGFNVTQATVSRDVKDMGLIKTLSADGKRYKYAAQQSVSVAGNDKFVNMFKGFALSVRTADTLIVVRTETGSANAVAEFIDRLDYPEILGVIAGDNTIFAAADSAYHAEIVADRLEAFLG